MSGAQGRFPRWWKHSASVVVTSVVVLLSGRLFGQCEEIKTPTFSLMDAVEASISNSPTLRLQQYQIDIAHAAKLQASSQFDTIFSSGFNHQRLDQPLTSATETLLRTGGLNAEGEVTNTSVLNGGFTRLFRNGISVGPRMSITRTLDDLAVPLGTNTSSANFQVTIPLRQGRGRRVVGASERAAQTEVDAARLDLNQDLADVLAVTAVDYWNLVAAWANYKIALDSKNRGQALLDNTRALIESDQLPASNMEDVVANLADRTAACLAAQAAVTQVWQTLIIAMGLDPSESLVPAAPADDFPDGLHQELPAFDTQSLRAWTEMASSSNANIMAGQKREEELHELVIGAKDQFKPRLNLVVSAGYAGLVEGRLFSEFFTSTLGGNHGPTVSAGLIYQSPTKNQAASQMMRTQASLRQAEIATQELRRSASSAVIVGLTNNRTAILRLRKAEESVSSLTRALENQREKFRLGVGSILDVLQVEDRLNAALQSRVQAQLAYAVSVANFRLATGTLVSGDRYSPKVDRYIFFRMPDLNSVQ